MRSGTNKGEEPEHEAQDEYQKQEALRLKNLAEAKYNCSNLKSALKYAKRAHRLYPDLDGLSEMVASFKILRIAAKYPGDHYKILQVEPFSHINTIKKHYKKLALTLHPDKDPYVGSEEAFKLVGESFRFLLDKIRRKEYDIKLRIRMQEEAGGSDGHRVAEDAALDTFWTACSRCRLLHQFERKYIGSDLVCPHCRKSFKAVEVKSSDYGRQESWVAEKTKRTRNAESSERVRTVNLRRKVGDMGLRRNISSEESREASGGWASGRLRRRVSSVEEISERPKTVNKAQTWEDLMTLAEMQLEIKEKGKHGKSKSKLSKKQSEERVVEVQEQEQDDVEEGENEEEDVDEEVEEDEKLERYVSLKKSRNIKGETQKLLKKQSLDTKRHCRSIKTGSLQNKRTDSKSKNMEIMPVEDSDFYDFDKDRVEKSFKKGQVWAIYDDDDGMPRHYGLIDEVVSVNPFVVEVSWLDFQNSGDDRLTCWEKMGYHISCGRFKVGVRTTVNSLNIFSHVVNCERAAREIYRIYPKKGSVWALYSEAASERERANFQSRDKRWYDIVVFLTSYSDVYGLSMGYLEKVDGFKTVFKRREIGCHAIRFLEKNDLRLISHQIPARKLTGNEVSEQLKECWELDPASLPSDLLTICC